MNELNTQFVANLKQKFSESKHIQVHLTDNNISEALLSENNFWEIIDLIDWKKKSHTKQLEKAVTQLATLPLSSIYIFADKLSEKLYSLDTKANAEAYSKNEIDNFLSVDGFLYARCAVIAEGKEYYETVLTDPYTNA